MTAARVLLVGWSSVLHGQVTAGDVLSMRTVEHALSPSGSRRREGWWWTHSSAA